MDNNGRRKRLRGIEQQPGSDASFCILRVDGEPRLVEFRSYAADTRLDDRTRNLVNRLAHLLHQDKEAAFRTPQCLGWINQRHKKRVAFVFAVLGAAADPSPISLLEVLSTTDSAPAPLGQRFGLALKLARCISQLQLVKWVHKSFRSENILFFHKQRAGKATPSPPNAGLHLCEPWVLGFEFSRPEPWFTQGRSDACLARDVHRHPDRQRHPTQPFNKLHDIYALGVVLLEIGLWQPALSLDKFGFTKVRNPNDVRKHLVRQAKWRLGYKMGERYRDVVLACLQGSFDAANDNKEDLKLQQAFRVQVIDVLEKAANCF